jgi:hypothetical protein
VIRDGLPTQRFDLSANARALHRQQAFVGALFVLSAVVAASFLALATWKVLAGTADGYQQFLLVGSVGWMAMSVWAAIIGLTPYPDQIEVGAEGWRATSRGKQVREGRWSDPRGGFKLQDYRDNAWVTEKLKVQPSLALGLIIFGDTTPLSPSSRSFWITPEAATALVENARARGVAVTSHREVAGSSPPNAFVVTQIGASRRANG